MTDEAAKERGVTQDMKGQTLRLTNAFVTIHEFSPHTAILNIVSIKEPWNRASIWVNHNELADLAAFIVRSESLLSAGIAPAAAPSQEPGKGVK